MYNVKYIWEKVNSKWAFYRKQYQKYKTIKTLLSGINPQPQIKQPATIVFNTVRSFPIHRDVELFLAYQLAMRGAKVKVFFDDGEMGHWDLERIHHIKKGTKCNPYFQSYERNRSLMSKFREKWIVFNHKIIQKAFEAAFRHENLQIINYSKVSDVDSNSVNLTEYDHNQAISSLKRFFETGVVDLTDEKQQWYYEKSLKNCEISKKVGSYILNHINPDLFISSHGIYSTWGPCYNLIKRAGVPSLIWEMQFGRNKKILLVDDIFQFLTRDSDWQKRKQKKPDTSEIKIVDEYFKTRFKHSSMDTQIYFKNLNGSNKNESFSEPLNENFVFGMFPNVIWDGDIYERNTIFKHLIEWIEFTIDKIKDTDKVLVIRFHPSETTFLKGTKKLEDILLERNSNLKNYKNIKFISSSTSVDTYAFAKQYVDIGLIYSGTLALELTHLNIPVISCSNSFYHQAGFCFEPDSKEEYSQQLRNGDSILEAFNKQQHHFQDKLNRFAYWYYYDAVYEMPIFAPDSVYDFCYEELEPDEVDPTYNKNLLKTVEKILHSTN